MPKRKLTKELCLDIASKCFNRNELQKVDCAVYKKMYAEGWLEEVFTKPIMKPVKWTDEDLRQIASQYQSKNEFKWGNYNAYHRARTRECFEDMCSHMVTKAVCDNNIIYLLKVKFSGIENLYKIGITSKRLRNRRLNELKSHSGFEFDVIKWVEVDNAREIEKTLLKYGTIPTVSKFQGYKELRVMNYEELNSVVDLLNRRGV